MKFQISLVLVVGVLAAACAQQPDPAPVTGWSQSASPGTTIRVQRGDTLFGLAHRYHQPVRLIIEANHLVTPYRLKVGQALILPSPDAPMPAANTYADAVPAPPAPPRYGRWPAPPRPTSTVAEVPPSMSDTPAIDSSEVPPSTRRPARTADAMQVNPPPALHPAAAAIVPHDAPPPPLVGSRGFIWPMRGHVVEGYGAARNGTQNDGINIAARAGAPIYAAAAGEVVYVGNELRGYGNLVLIKHEGGYLTAYAHNSAILVHKGDHVARGQTIARVGATGEVSEPQLHFEIRVGRAPVDPAQYLPPVQQASIGE